MINFNSLDEIQPWICMMILQPEYNAHLLELEDKDIPINTYRRQDVLLGRDLYRFIKSFIETKAGVIPPKSMVIQHFILESLFKKCPLSSSNTLLLVSLNNYINVQHKIKIEENSKLPF